MSKLHNVRGRITYISSHAKQENLYAVYETTDRHYWTELTRCNQQEFTKSGTEGKCIEARELIIALPESFCEFYPDKLLQIFTDRFKEKYGVECVSALHHNKRKTNYHIHLIFSERELLPEPIEKIATRNMFYNEDNKHVRTKKEILDDNGNLRKGCRIIPKGEIYERTLFTAKNKLFKQESFIDEAKHYYTDLMNSWTDNDKEKLHVFDKDGLYLATKKIGKNNPKAEQIQADNEVRMSWNREVDRAILSEVPDAEIREIKTRWITKRIKNHITILGEHPVKFASIILYAIDLLSKIIINTLEAAKAMKEKLLLAGSLIETPETKPVEPPKPQIPPKPEMALEAAAYEKLHKYWTELDRQNDIIFEIEKQRNSLEFERDDLKGLAKLTKKKGLDSEIAQKNQQIEILKIGLSNMIKNFGFANMGDFYLAHHTSRQAYYEYHDKLEAWENAYGEASRQQTESIRGRLQELKEEARRQNSDTFTTHHNNHKKERGAR